MATEEKGNGLTERIRRAAGVPKVLVLLVFILMTPVFKKQLDTYAGYQLMSIHLSSRVSMGAFFLSYPLMMAAAVVTFFRWRSSGRRATAGMGTFLFTLAVAAVFGMPFGQSYLNGFCRRFERSVDVEEFRKWKDEMLMRHGGLTYVEGLPPRLDIPAEQQPAFLKRGMFARTVDGLTSSCYLTNIQGKPCVYVGWHWVGVIGYPESVPLEDPGLRFIAPGLSGYFLEP